MEAFAFNAKDGSTVEGVESIFDFLFLLFDEW
jgi:hypothetical protein